MGLLSKFIAGAAEAGAAIVTEEMKARILAQRDEVLHRYRMEESEADIKGREGLIDRQAGYEKEAIKLREEGEGRLIGMRGDVEGGLLDKKIKAEQPKIDAEIRASDADANYKTALAEGRATTRTTKPKWVQQRTTDAMGQTVYGDWVNTEDPTQRLRADGTDPNASDGAGTETGDEPPPGFADYVKRAQEKFGVDISTDKKAMEMIRKGDRDGFLGHIRTLAASNTPAEAAKPTESMTQTTSAPAQTDSAGILAPRIGSQPQDEPTEEMPVESPLDAATNTELDKIPESMYGGVDGALDTVEQSLAQGRDNTATQERLQFLKSKLAALTPQQRRRYNLLQSRLVDIQTGTAGVK